MRSELFEETLKQHKHALTDELVKLGKHRQAQLAEWDIEQNESEYEFYFNGGWNAQQSKVDELQKRVDALIQKYKDEDRELKLIDEWEKSQIYGLVASELEQAVKGGEA